MSAAPYLRCVALVGAMVAVAAHAAAPKGAVATIELEPVVDGTVAEMRVVEHLPQAFLAPGEPLTLAFATLAPAHTRTTDTVVALIARDAAGPLTLTGPSREGANDLWRANRPVRGDVTVRYRVPAAAIDRPHSGPITYLQTSGGGLSGKFASVLLLPRSASPVDVAVQWHLPAGQQAVSSAGTGDFRRRMAIGDLGDAMFVAGPLAHAPAVVNDRALVVAALARPQAEVDQARPWLTRAHAAMAAAFGAGKADGYRVMVFSHDRQANHSGTSGPGGFLFFLPPDQHLYDKDNQSILAHELVHSFVRSYDPDAEGDGADDWYDEGIADYAGLIVPHAAGLFSSRDYLDLVNDAAAFYYLNRLRLTPTADIPAIKWTVNRAWTLGYSRGAMYFANLDAGLRARRSRTTVMGLIARMNARKPASGSGATAWEALLREQAGPWAVAEWRAMLAGQLLRPVDGAFGPCLVACRIAAGHFDLGVSKTGFAKGDRIGNVVSGCNAYKAGVRAGDVLRETFEMEGLDNSFDRLATLKILREGKPLDITFAPRTGTEEAYRFHPRSGDPNRPCG